MKETFTTNDIWLGSVLLSEAEAELMDIQVSRNGRESIMFCFQGKDLSRYAQSYCREETIANVTQLRSKLNFLRDLIFQQRSKH